VTLFREYSAFSPNRSIHLSEAARSSVSLNVRALLPGARTRPLRDSASPAPLPAFAFLGATSVFFKRGRRWTCPVIVYHITLIHMVITRLSRATPARRKLSGQCDGQCRRGVCAGGHGTVGRRSSDTEVAAEGTGAAAGGSGGRAGGSCECDIEFAPWRRACYRQCPTAGPEAICSLCDEIYESFQRTRGAQLSAGDREEERTPDAWPRARATARGTCARCPIRAYAHPREHVPLVSALELRRGWVTRSEEGIFPARRIFDFRDCACTAAEISRTIRSLFCRSCDIDYSLFCISVLLYGNFRRFG